MKSISALDLPAFVVTPDGEIEVTTVRELCPMGTDLIKNPAGEVVPRLHRRLNELWSWGLHGQYPARVMMFADDDTAQHILEGEYAEQFWRDTTVAYRTWDAAECAAEGLLTLQFEDN